MPDQKHVPVIGCYSGVDASSKEEQAASVVALDVMAQVPAIRRLKAWVLEQLDAQPGMVAVDVGCGTGEDTQGLSVLVQPGGQAVGVDPSETMLIQARRRAAAAGSSARFEAGKAQHLPFGDGSVDLLRCERVLQHMSSPAGAVAEMSRVLRPGGRVGLIDTDWRSLTFWPDPDGVGGAVRDAWAARAQTPSAGAQLLDLVTACGFESPRIAAEAVLLRSRDAADRPPLTLMTDVAVQSGRLEPEVVEEWLDGVRSVATRGGFLALFVMTAVAARRP